MDRPVSAALTQSTATGRRGVRGLIAVIAVAIVLPIVSPSSFLLLSVGLLPSLVALIVDRTPQKFATACVSALNVAGVAPFLFELWFRASGTGKAAAIITDPFAMVVIYGAAAFGWLLFLGVPMASTHFDAIVVDRRLQRLRERQQELLEEWGDAVAGPANGAAADRRADP